MDLSETQSEPEECGTKEIPSTDKNVKKFNHKGIQIDKKVLKKSQSDEVLPNNISNMNHQDLRCINNSLENSNNSLRDSVFSEHSNNGSLNNRVSFHFSNKMASNSNVESMHTSLQENSELGVHSNDYPFPARRPDSLPLGDPPSYTEALSYSPVMYSLPCEFALRKTRSMFALEESRFNGIVVDNLTDDPKTARRLVALPAVHRSPGAETIRRTSLIPGLSHCNHSGLSQEIVVPAREGFDDHPCSAFCKQCQITVLTTVSSRYKSTTYCCCFLMFFSGVCCPLSFLPFMFCGPRKVYHSCPQCKTILGIHLSH